MSCYNPSSTQVKILLTTKQTMRWSDELIAEFVGAITPEYVEGIRNTLEEDGVIQQVFTRLAPNGEWVGVTNVKNPEANTAIERQERLRKQFEDLRSDCEEGGQGWVVHSDAYMCNLLVAKRSVGGDGIFSLYNFVQVGIGEDAGWQQILVCRGSLEDALHQNALYLPVSSSSSV